MVNKKLFFVALFISMLLCGCAELFMPYDGGWAQNDNSMIDYSATTTKRTQQRRDKNTKESHSAEQTTLEKGDIELVCYGESTNIDAAIRSALRSGIEQTYGAFVSSNTRFLNEEIVRDEISTVASGNIKKYDIVSKEKIGNKWCVLVKATISKTRLASYVKAHGGSADLDGATFAANYFNDKFYKEAEKKVLCDMIKKLKEFEPQILDYEISLKDPIDRYKDWWEHDVLNGVRCEQCKHSFYQNEPGFVYVPITITCKINKNIHQYQDILLNTLKALNTRKYNSSGGINYTYLIKKSARDKDGKKRIIKADDMWGNPGLKVLYVDSSNYAHATYDPKDYDFIFHLRNNIHECFEPGDLPYEVSNWWNWGWKNMGKTKGYFVIEDGTSKKVRYASQRYTWYINYQERNLYVGDYPPGTMVWSAEIYLKYTVEELSKIKTITVNNSYNYE